MNYGAAIEAMKRGDLVKRDAQPDCFIHLAAADGPLAYFEATESDGERAPFVPTTADQLAEDWGIAA